MPGYDFRVDWNNDGSFESPGEDLTAGRPSTDNSVGRVLLSSPVSAEYGRDQARSLAPPRVGVLGGLVVNNRSGDYNPENASSPLATQLKPGRPLWFSYNQRANLVPNPSFEDGTTGWSSSRATLSTTTGNKIAGDRSLHLVISSVLGTPTVDSQRFPVRGSTTYTVSAYSRFSSGSGSRASGVKLIFYDAAGGIVLNPSTSSTVGLAGQWIRRSATLTSPPDAAQAAVIYAFTNASVSDTHQIDAVMVEESATLRPYFDGSFGGDIDVPNPGFEADTSDWVANGSSIVRSTAQARSGVASCQMTPNGSSASPSVDQTTAASHEQPVIPGLSYTMSAWVRSPTGYSQASIAILWRSASDSTLSTNFGNTTDLAVNNWTNLTVTATAPAGAAYALLRVRETGTPSTSDILFVDDVDFYITPGTDGGAFWRTTEHASASLIGYVLYYGHIDDFDVTPDRFLPTVQFSAMDATARLREANVSTPVYAGIRTGEAVEAVLDAIDWPADKRDIDTGATHISWWWEEDTDAFTALERIVNSEGPPAMFTVGVNGELIFRDRHHRLLRPRSTTSQVTFRDSGTEPLLSKPFTYNAGFREVVNTVTFNVDERTPRSFDVVWSTDDTVAVTAGTPLQITASSTDPFIEAQTPAAANSDFEVLSGSVSVSLSRTSGQSTTITLTSAAGAVLSGLRLRARPVRVARTVKVESIDSASVTDHGPRRYDEEAPWMGRRDAASIGQLILNQRAQRTPTVSIPVIAQPATMPARFAAGMGRDLSDRITIVESESGINADFYVEQITHTTGPLTHTVTLGCEKVPAVELSSPTTVFVLNSATNGVLNTNRLGY